MGDRFEKFDAVNLRLEKGMHLVEAGAGTGKTYAITMLVLRAIVELKIPIDQILIVTFTKAATEELRGRIRARLTEARDLFTESTQQAGNKGDVTLNDWAGNISDRKDAFVRLQTALYEIDCAAIFTIHGYCQRMLVEQALESDQLFETELLADIETVQKQVVEDYWRKHIYPMAPLPCAIITERFSTPDALLDSISLALNKGRFDQVVPQTSPLQTEIDLFTSAMGKISDWWRVHKKDVRDQFEKAVHEKAFKKKVSEDSDTWFGRLDAFLSRDSLLVPAELEFLSKPVLLAELSGSKFRSKEKREHFLSDWVLPGEDLEDLLRSIDNLLLSFRVGLANDLCPMVSKRLMHQGSMGFDDLIRNLASGLRGEGGKKAGRLQKVLADRYSFVLIDEFQDTDRDQYDIFSTLFAGDNHYLYMIGDPKQAIYKFRGADIYSYFLAKRSASTLLTLDRNYRSHPFLVQEINRLFSSRPEPFSYEKKVLGYDPVDAAKTEEELTLKQGGRDGSGMVYCKLMPNADSKDGRWSSGLAKEQCRRFVVAEIAKLLSSGSSTVVSGAHGEETFERSLAPKDIAVLVRKNSEAEEYRNSLGQCGIPAVVTSRVSVFHTPECRELLLLLQGISNPGDLGRLKASMTISWFGFTGDDLREIWEDDVQLSVYQTKFSDYLVFWREQNFLSMMNRLLEQEEVLLNLASQPFAERKIANIFQLMELVQDQVQNENLGVGQTLYWLLQMNREEKPGEGGELLLESDEEAVQLVTMHGAKGLEYPVVFCPVLWSGTDFFQKERNQVVAHEGEKKLVLDLGSADFNRRKELARKEQFAEDIRLVYVALTRAKLRCYTFWSDVKKHGASMGSFDSALGYLLFPEGVCGSDRQLELLKGVAESHPLELIEIGADIQPVAYIKEDQQGELAPKVTSDRSLQTAWQLTSFSAMTMLSEEHHVDSYLDSSQVEGGLQSETRMIEFADLPAGPKFGNVVHDLLEELSFGRIDLTEECVAACDSKLQSYGVEMGAEELARLLLKVVTTKLPPGFALCDLDDARCLKEMEFYFQLSPLITGEINTVLAEEKTVLPLTPRSMRGYMTGFIDLVCEFEGKYYILDYKTNNLGSLVNNYTVYEMEQAMQAHNYGLQYWLYTLVLHRHLQNVLPSYSYEKDFGGVLYLFLRGMSGAYGGKGDNSDNGIYFVRPKMQTLEQMDRVMGGHTNV